jgi:DNA-binding ferritin-like protein (Dps family)|tara:strand:+ start:247 stop:399 length:153 start_codon:yes stop_codon:yes gene_type:complete
MKTNGIEQLKKIEENYNKNKNLKEMEDAMEKLPIEIINLWNEIKKRKINK